MKNKHIVMDVETGGLDAYQHPITQAAWQVVGNKKLELLEAGSTFVKPYSDEWIITPEAVAASQVSITQINNGMPHPAFTKSLVKVFDAAKNKGGKFTYKPILVGHNFTFDIVFLEVLFALMNKDLYDYVERYFYCTMREQMRMEGYIDVKKDKKTYNLSAVCERLGIKLKNAHGAANDVDATTKVFIKQTQILRLGNGNAGQITTTDIKRESIRNTFEM